MLHATCLVIVPGFTFKSNCWYWSLFGLRFFIFYLFFIVFESSDTVSKSLKKAPQVVGQRTGLAKPPWKYDAIKCMKFIVCFVLLALCCWLRLMSVLVSSYRIQKSSFIPCSSIKFQHLCILIFMKFHTKRKDSIVVKLLFKTQLANTNVLLS